jgi:hypothetical protein
MNRMEEPYFNKPDTNSINKPTMSSSDSIPSSSSNDFASVTIGSIDSKTIIILLLFFFLLISVLGINILNILGNLLQSLADFFGPVINQFLNSLGYSAGTALDKVSDVTADAAKVGIDIADGALNNIGGLLKGSETGMYTDNINVPPPSNKALPPPMDETPTPSPLKEPSPDSSENTIQKPITSDKWNWCLVGEYQNKRGCIEITDSDKCMSGQVFPSQQMCLNPTWTSNV